MANRLAESGEEWTKIYEENNSGTYNDQFMIIDYKRFAVGDKPLELDPELLWVCEQMPGTVESADVTGMANELLMSPTSLRSVLLLSRGAQKTRLLGLL